MIVQFVNRQSKEATVDWQKLIRLVANTVEKSEYLCQEWQKQGYRISACVTFAGPRVIRKINREHRGIDAQTDVLSFPMLDLKEGSSSEPISASDLDYSQADQPELFLGDILINLDRARQQADEYGHSLKREIAFLAVHGMLHLLGYDHQNQKEENKMISRQNELLGLMSIERN